MVEWFETWDGIMMRFGDLRQVRISRSEGQEIETRYILLCQDALSIAQDIKVVWVAGARTGQSPSGSGKSCREIWLRQHNKGVQAIRIYPYNFVDQVRLTLSSHTRNCYSDGTLPCYCKITNNREV